MIKFALQTISEKGRLFYVGYSHNGAYCNKYLKDAILWNYPHDANLTKTTIFNCNPHFHATNKSFRIVEIEVDIKDNRKFKKEYELPDGYKSSAEYVNDINNKQKEI